MKKPESSTEDKNYPRNNSIPWNIAVVGLPIDTQESYYDARPGKSFMCNRYMKPDEDKQWNSHDSILPADAMKLSHVFNNDQFLYWGNKTVNLNFTAASTTASNTTTSSTDANEADNDNNKMKNIEQLINILEFTYLYESSSYCDQSNPNVIYRNYLKYITQNVFCSTNKVAYICHEQAIQPDNNNTYAKHYLHTGYHDNQFAIDCYIVVISVEESIQFINQQLTFLLSFYHRIRQKIIDSQVTVLIAATKCDSMEYMETLDVLKDYLHKNQLDLPLVEVSSMYNVNVVNCFEIVVHLHYYRKCIMNMNNGDAFVSQIKLFDGIRKKSVDTCILPLHSHKYNNVDTNAKLISLKELPQYFDSVDSFQVRFTKNCLSLNQYAQQFISLITKYAEELSSQKYNNYQQFHQLIILADNATKCDGHDDHNLTTDIQILNDNISVFGEEKLADIFQEVYIHRYTLIEKWIRQKYIETFIQALNSIFSDINSLSVCSWKWDKCLQYLEGIPSFNEYFVKNSESISWNSVKRMNNYVYLFVLDNDAATRLFKFKVPFDFLDIHECRIEFDRFLQELAEKNNQEAVVSQLEEQLLRMIDEGEFKACDAVEEVAYHLLFRGYDRLSQAIMEYEFTPIFTKYSEMLKEQAKRNFHELLFENAIAIDLLLQGKFKMGSVRNLIQNDNRFKDLDGKLDNARDGWIINHLASRDRSDICILNFADESSCIRNVASVFIKTFPPFLVPFKRLPNQEYSRENPINIFLICSTSQFANIYNVVMDHYGGKCEERGDRVLNSTFSFNNIMDWYENDTKNNTNNNSGCTTNDKDTFLCNEVSFPFRLIWFENKWANLKHIEQKFIPISYTNFFVYFAQADTQAMLYDFINSFSNVIYQDLDANQLNFATKRIVNSVTIFQPAKNREPSEHSSLSRHDSLSPSQKLSTRDKRSSSVNKTFDAQTLSPENKKFLSSLATSYDFKIEEISSPPEKCFTSILYALIRNSDYITQYNLEVDHKINIAVCMMCGDSSPIEMVARMLIFNRKYFYFNETNTFRILFESQPSKITYYVDITFVPYHSTHKWGKIGGSIAVCTTGRLASIEAMRALMHRNLGLPTHIICMLAKLRKSPSGVDCNVCQHTQLASKSAIQLLSDEGLSPTLFEAFRKLNVFFELCCENNTQQCHSVSESIDDITAGDSTPSNMDVFSKESNKIRSLIGSRLKKGRQTIAPGAISCNSALYTTAGNSTATKVAWHKNPMYHHHPLSVNTISGATSKSRKWTTNRIKKGEKSITATTSLYETNLENIAGTTIIANTPTTVATTTKIQSYIDVSSTTNEPLTEKVNSDIDLASTNNNTSRSTTMLTMKEHKQPERYKKMLRHQQLTTAENTSTTNPYGGLRSGSLTASDYTSSETQTIGLVGGTKNQNNAAICLDIISSGYLNTLSRSHKSRSSNKICSTDSSTVHVSGGGVRGMTKKKHKIADKGKFSNQFNKMFSTIKARTSKILPNTSTYNANYTSTPHSNSAYNMDSKSNTMSVVDKIEQWSTIKIKKDLNFYNNGEPQDSFIGKPLCEVCDSDSGTTPKFIEKVIVHIEAKGLQTEGLYRISGRKLNIDQLISSYHQDNSIDFESLDYNVHVFTSCLKSFIKSLPIPLFPQNLFDKLLNKPKENNEIHIETIHDICSNLDKYSFETFKILMKHLHNVSQFSTTNQMMPNNLSLCWWPTIVRPAVESITKINQDGAVFTAFFTTIIGKYFDIFPEITLV